jgi:hypothetical protein
MLRTQHAGSHGGALIVDREFDNIGLCKSLGVKVTRYWQELHGPTLDQYAFLAEIRIASRFQIGEDWIEQQ